MSFEFSPEQRLRPIVTVWDGRRNLLKRMAPQVGLEPTTLRLTAGCSAIELLRSVGADKFGALQISFHQQYMDDGELRQSGRASWV